MDIINLNQSNTVDLKSEQKKNNSQIILMNNQLESKQIDDPILKTYYPIYLYKPPFGYPRNVNVVFLRELAKNPYVFSIIKAITDQAAETKWEIKPKEGVDMTDELEQSKKYITEFFKNPNSDNESFSQLLRKVIPDILTLDSGCFVKVYNRKKELVQLRAMDGGAILKNPDRHGSLFSRTDVITDDAYFGMGAGKGFENQKQEFKKAVDKFESYGYTEQAAYYQFAYGMNYSVPIPYGKKEIIYLMENPSSETVYSRSSALQSSIDITLNLIYSSKASLDLFLNANIPTGIIQLAEASSEDTKAFQDGFYNQQYSGVDEYGLQRRVNGRLPVVGNPNVNFIPLTFKTNENEVIAIQQWFTKVLWACFGVNSSEMGFTAGDSKATDQSQSKVAARKAVRPRLNLVGNYLNDQVMPELPDGNLFEFVFDEYDIEEDAKKWALYETKIRMGVLTPEMVADKEGIDVLELTKQKEQKQEQEAELNNTQPSQAQLKSIYDSGIELKHKYIKRIGSPGSYKYIYYDNNTGATREGSAPKKEVQGSKGRKYLIEKAISDANKKHTDEENKQINKYVSSYMKGDTSQNEHTDSKGNYTKERLKLHDEIMNRKNFNNPKAKGGKTLFIFAGSPASGKTSALKKYIEGADYVDLNADDIKEHLDHKGTKFNGYNAAVVHDESSHILSKLVDKHIKEGSNILLDQTMKDPVKSEKIIQRFKDQGYKVHLYAAFVEPHVAIERASNRFKKEKRYVPYELISGVGDNIKKNAHAVRDKVDSYTFVDNNGDFQNGGKPYKIS